MPFVIITMVRAKGGTLKHGMWGEADVLFYSQSRRGQQNTPRRQYPRLIDRVLQGVQGVK